ncbi:MAG: hypothetical protein ACOCV2_03010 [Persicimonas sp.]
MQCEVCGNDYDKAMTIAYLGEEHTFDCFECAITELAPRCARCNSRVIGHGSEADGEIYCSAHCAGLKGHGEMRDRS